MPFTLKWLLRFLAVSVFPEDLFSFPRGESQQLPKLTDDEKKRDEGDAKIAKTYKHIKNKEKRSQIVQKEKVFFD
jgi:hypothetical protein